MAQIPGSERPLPTRPAAHAPARNEAAPTRRNQGNSPQETERTSRTSNQASRGPSNQNLGGRVNIVV